MSGTKIGGQKAAYTNKKRHGDNFYAKIGRKGGRKSRGGGFTNNPQLASKAGKLGGAISQRGSKAIRENNPLTVEMLEEMKPNTIFKKGTSIDSPEGLHLTGSGRKLKWVAVRGGIADWAVYAHHYEKDWQAVKDWGDKVTNKNSVAKLFPFTGGAWERYRL